LVRLGEPHVSRPHAGLGLLRRLLSWFGYQCSGRCPEICCKKRSGSERRRKGQRQALLGRIVAVGQKAQRFKLCTRLVHKQSSDVTWHDKVTNLTQQTSRSRAEQTEFTRNLSSIRPSPHLPARALLAKTAVHCRPLNAIYEYLKLRSHLPQGTRTRRRVAPAAWRWWLAVNEEQAP